MSPYLLLTDNHDVPNKNTPAPSVYRALPTCLAVGIVFHGKYISASQGAPSSGLHHFFPLPPKAVVLFFPFPISR